MVNAQAAITLRRQSPFSRELFVFLDPSTRYVHQKLDGWVYSSLYALTFFAFLACGYHICILPSCGCSAEER
jgi:hypothetical protein